MTGISPPQIGEDVSVLTLPSHRHRGRITAGSSGMLTVELEETPLRLPLRLPSGFPVELEWIHPLGLMQLSARVEASRLEPVATLEVALDGPPELAERRTRERVPVTLEASAWSLLDPTRLVSGETVDVSAGGALLRLPGLAPFASVVEVRIGLPEQPFSTKARVVRRSEPDLVGIAFQAMRPEDQQRLEDFVRESSRRLERPAR